jgi:hypothetical protein
MFEINQISFPSLVIHETKFIKRMTHSLHSYIHKYRVHDPTQVLTIQKMFN